MHQKFIINVVYMTCAQYSKSSDVMLFFWVSNRPKSLPLFTKKLHIQLESLWQRNVVWFINKSFRPVVNPFIEKFWLKRTICSQIRHHYFKVYQDRIFFFFNWTVSLMDIGHLYLYKIMMIMFWWLKLNESFLQGLIAQWVRLFPSPVIQALTVIRLACTLPQASVWLDSSAPQDPQILVLCFVLLDTTVPEAHHYPCPVHKAQCVVSEARS